VTQFVLGLFAGVLAFFFKDFWDVRRRRRQRLRTIGDALLSAAEEIDFYLSKITQLVADIEEDIRNLSPQTGATVPSYSLYPEFLASLRLALADRMLVRPFISRVVGECHFELSHLSQRLEENKGNLHLLNLTNSASVLAHVGNWRGLQKLASENEDRFKNAARELRLEAARFQSVVDNYELWSGSNLQELIAAQNVRERRN